MVMRLDGKCSWCLEPMILEGIYNGAEKWVCPSKKTWHTYSVKVPKKCSCGNIMAPKVLEQWTYYTCSCGVEELEPNGYFVIRPDTKWNAPGKCSLNYRARKDAQDLLYK